MTTPAKKKMGRPLSGPEPRTALLPSRRIPQALRAAIDQQGGGEWVERVIRAELDRQRRAMLTR